MKYLAIIYLYYFIYDIIQAQQVTWKALVSARKAIPV